MHEVHVMKVDVMNVDDRRVFIQADDDVKLWDFLLRSPVQCWPDKTTMAA